MTLTEIRRRYANARRRARYWSGNPSDAGFGAHGRKLTSCRMAEKYGMAMADCEVWEDDIAEITGKPVKHYDPKAAFAARLTRLMKEQP